MEKVASFDDLRKLSQWVCYTSDKKPINPHSCYGADCNNPETWSTYDHARLIFHNSHGRLAGIGFEFVKLQCITGVDLDKCVIDGEISDFAQGIINRLNSYTEYSPSGSGIHIWVRGSIPDNLKSDGHLRIEMYDHARYFTVTGNHLADTPKTIEYRQDELQVLYDEIAEQRRKIRGEKASSKIISFPSNGHGTPYGLKALSDECSTLVMASEGGRNNQLNASAFALGQLIAGGELTDRSFVENELAAVAQSLGLPDREIEKTLQSGIESGLREPRAAPPSKYAKYEPSDIPSTNCNGHYQSSANEITSEELCGFTEDDAGNGDALYALFGQDFLYCPSRGWFVYVGTHWKLDTDGAEVRKRAVETLRRRRHAAVDLQKEPIIKCTKGDEGRVNGCVNRFRTLVNVSIDEFDNNPDLLNCKNGVVDLCTGSLEPHNRNQRFTYCVPVTYEPVESQELIDYLNGVVGGGQEIIDYLQLALGYSLTGHTREEILFYLFGPPRSGKGTISEIFMALLPSPLSTGVDFNSFTAKREGDVSNFDLAPLKPARMIFASESLRNQTLNPAKIKQLTGGDRIRACFKHKDFFEYRPQFKVWMLSNWPVNGDPEDEALWGRVRVIEFPNSYLGQEDKMKKARLKDPDVLQGVLYWAVQGAIKWYALGSAGLTTPNAVILATKKQRDELDYVQQWFDECCEMHEGHWTPNEEVSKSYTLWCKNNNVQYPKGPKALAQSLQSKGFTTGVQKKVEGKNRKGVSGLYIYPEDQGLTDG